MSRRREIFARIQKTGTFFVFAAAFLIQTGAVFAQTVRTQINASMLNVGKRIDIDTERSIGAIVGGVIQVALGFLGLIFLILFTYGAFKWMEAKGEEKTVKEATGLMFQAIVGLAIVLGAYALTEFFVTALEKSAGFK